MKYHKYNDPGHGWLKVAKSELVRLGIANKISAYSYMRGDYAYLEEDSDCSTFCNALEKEKGIAINFSELVAHHYGDKSSKIRSYASYKMYSEDEKSFIAKIVPALIGSKTNWSATAIRKFQNADIDSLKYWSKLYLTECPFLGRMGQCSEGKCFHEVTA